MQVIKYTVKRAQLLRRLTNRIIKMADGDEKMSKNALKKLQKAEQAAEKKAEKDRLKADAAAATGGGKSKPKDDAEELDPTKYFENRTTAIIALEKSGRTAFPHKFHNTHRFGEYVAEFNTLAEGEHIESANVSIAGRVISKRNAGKLMFYDVHGDGLKIQVMSDISNYTGMIHKILIVITAFERIIFLSFLLQRARRLSMRYTLLLSAETLSVSLASLENQRQDSSLSFQER